MIALRMATLLLCVTGCAASSSLRGLASAQSCDVEAACRGASGEARGYCLEEERVKCCIRDGGAQEQCCAAASFHIRARDVCKANKPSCNAEAACRGASGEARGLCLEEEHVKCCISGGGSQGQCCGAASFQIRARPVCSRRLDAQPAGNSTNSLHGLALSQYCDTETACRGCSGEQRELCREEAHVQCCINGGGSQEQCCAAASAGIRGRPLCRPRCDVEAACRGCSGEQCEYCREEEHVKCCIRDGGSQQQCCAAASFHVRSSVCPTPAPINPPACDPEASCPGCNPGLDCMNCYATAKVSCCIGNHPENRHMCCSGAGPAMKNSAICRGA